VPRLVQEEFGPSLPEVVAERTGTPVRTTRRVLIGALVVLVILVLVVRAVQRDAARGEPAIVRDVAQPFNLIYDSDRLERVDPGPGEALRLQSPRGADPPLLYTVTERDLPAYSGDAAGFLPLHATRLIEAQRAADPDFVLRGEGKARINQNPGYQIQFQTKVDGDTAYGKRFLLYVDPDETEETINRPRTIADVLLLNGRSAAVPNVAAVGGNGPLKNPLRSFRFGTERP
jgi:hypothetical protein